MLTGCETSRPPEAYVFLGMRYLWAFLLAAGLVSAQVPDPGFLAARKKLSSITQDAVVPGSAVRFSRQEVNSYILAMLPRYVPAGIRDPVVNLATGQVTGSAQVNFIALAKSLGSNPNRILENLVDGEYPVSVTIDVTSNNGQVRVDLKRVTISGHTIEGAPLDFLVRNVFLARFPEARIGQAFELDHGIRQIDVQPRNVRVWVGP
jgi:hypothetical protein